MATFKRFFATSLLVGYLGGLLFAGIEGLQAVLAIQLGPASKTLRSWKDIGLSVAMPFALYPVLGCLVALVVALVVYPFVARRARSASPAGLTGLATAVVAAACVGGWALMSSNPFLTVGSLVSPSRILFNVQTVGVGILGGIGVGVVVYGLCARFGSRAVGLAFGSISPSAALAGMLLVWAKRNLPLWHTPWKVILALALVGLAFFGMAALFWRILSWAYRPATGLPRRLALPVILLAACFSLLSSGMKPRFHLMEGGRGGKGIKVILLTIDTLRADHLGCYGHHRPTSPVMDAIASEGTLFWNARSQSPWTLSSIASFMTSTYPSVNAVLTGHNKLEDARITLAEKMRDAGMLTQAIVTNGWLQDVFGTAQGFDGYHHSGDVFNWGRYQRMLWMRIARRFWPNLFPLFRTFLAKDVVDRAIEWLGLHHDRDFFLWIHTVDPHDPYQPPREYAGFFEDTPYTGRFKESSGFLNNLRSGARLTPEDKEHFRVLYDREIRYTDDQVGRLVQAMRELGIWDQTLFIISSDHGEEFWEHDGIMHGHTLYDENLRVPLIFRLPGRIPAGRVIHEPVRLLDLMPTILDFYGLDGSPEMQGVSLVPLIEGRAMPSNPAFAEALLYFDELKAILKDGYKLILNPSSGKTMLFDLVNDPAERWDLARQDSVRARLMLAELRDWMRASQVMADTIPHSVGGTNAHIDADTEAQLRALGYLN